MACDGQGAHVLAPPPKSNGMMLQTSLARPEFGGPLDQSTPVESGPLVVVPKVMTVLRPGLFALTVFSASTTRCRTVALRPLGVLDVDVEGLQP